MAFLGTRYPTSDLDALLETSNLDLVLIFTDAFGRDASLAEIPSACPIESFRSIAQVAEAYIFTSRIKALDLMTIDECIIEIDANWIVDCIVNSWRSFRGRTGDVELIVPLAQGLP